MTAAGMNVRKDKLDSTRTLKSNITQVWNKMLTTDYPDHNDKKNSMY